MVPALLKTYSFTDIAVGVGPWVCRRVRKAQGFTGACDVVCDPVSVLASLNLWCGG